MNPDQTSFQETILDSITDGVFTVDMDWNITSFNKSAERITGIPKNLALGRQCREIFRADVCERECLLRNTLRTGKPFINKTVHIINKQGKKLPVSISTALLKDIRGKIVGGVETFRDLSVIEELRKEILKKNTFSDIVTKDHAMLRIFDVMPGISKSNSTILVLGESGTGKELLARSIHALSDRSGGPFVSVNCGALPDTLLESELFGYKKGAFTDAKQDKPGRFSLAKGGTLFLDEIGDISKAMQIKLLRVLQEKTYEPLGSVRQESADVRVIAATNQDLQLLVEEKKFRKDLYYRINVPTVTLPPLKKRKGDIPLLIEHFIDHFNIIYEKNIEGLSPEAVNLLVKHDYPGNIRELRNIIEHGFIMCLSARIGVQDLPEYLRINLPEKREDDNLAVGMQEVERQRILSALEENRFNRHDTAEQLQMHTTTLWRKMKKLGL